MPLEIIICDDDGEARKRYDDLLHIIARKNGIAIKVKTYENGEQLAFALDDKDFNPDIVFLDVLMPKKNGIDAARLLQDRHFAGVVIFISSSSEYAFQAFDVRAFNYILKGDEKDLDRFERVFLDAVDTVADRKQRFILINGITERRNIPLDNIEYFEVCGHVCVVHCVDDDDLEFLSTLGKLENMLMPHGFLRSHRAFLVNSAFVRSYSFSGIEMNSGAQIPLGRKYQADFKEAMEARATLHIQSEKSKAGASKTGAAASKKV